MIDFCSCKFWSVDTEIIFYIQELEFDPHCDTPLIYLKCEILVTILFKKKKNRQIFIH
jgi:hypothetical protein